MFTTCNFLKKLLFNKIKNSWEASITRKEVEEIVKDDTRDKQNDRKVNTA